MNLQTLQNWNFFTKKNSTKFFTRKTNLLSLNVYVCGSAFEELHNYLFRQENIAESSVLLQSRHASNDRANEQTLTRRSSSKQWSCSNSIKQRFTSRTSLLRCLSLSTTATTKISFIIYASSKQIDLLSTRYKYAWQPRCLFMWCLKLQYHLRFFRK